MHRRNRKQSERSRGGKTAWLGLIVSTTLLAAFVNPEKCKGQLAQWPRIEKNIALVGSVPDLTDLHVFEDGIEQPDATLKKDTEPVSISLMLDISSSMKENSGLELEAARHFIAAVNPDDQIQLVSFSFPTYIEQDFTLDRAKIEAALRTLKFAGASAFYDGLSATIDEMKKHLPDFRPVIVILSDGDDNASHIRQQDLLRKLMSSDAPVVYSINPPAISEKGESTLTFFTKATGGVASRPPKVSLFPSAVEEIARDIHNRYKLEYTSTHAQKDGKLHKIELRVQSQAGSSKAKPIFQQEYYAPSR